MNEYREFEQEENGAPAAPQWNPEPTAPAAPQEPENQTAGHVPAPEASPSAEPAATYHYGRYAQGQVPGNQWNDSSYAQPQQAQQPQQPFYNQEVPQFDYTRYQQPAQPEQPAGKKAKKPMSTPLVVTITALTTAAVMLLSYIGLNLVFFRSASITENASSVSSSQSSKPAPGPAEDAFTITPAPETDLTLPAASEGQLTGAQVAAKVKPSVVCIQTFLSGNTLSSKSEGSGIIFTEDGYIITNAHVVENASSIKVVLFNGDSYEATVVGSDTTTDLAVIKADADGLVPAEFGDSSKLLQGDSVMAVGNPGGMAFNSSVSMGVVSAVDRPVASDVGYTMNCIQTDAAINPGNSGGPLVNMYGQVVGINSSKIVANGYEGLGFAISINEAQSIISDLKAFGYVTGRVHLGILYQMVDSMISQMYSLPVGVYIQDFTTTFMPDNGFEKGDILVEADDQPLSKSADLTNLLMEKSPGDTITFKVYRSSEQKYYQVTITLKEQADHTPIQTEDVPSLS